MNRKQRVSLSGTAQATADTDMHMQLEPREVARNLKPQDVEACQLNVDSGGHFDVRGRGLQSPNVVLEKGEDAQGLNTELEEGVGDIDSHPNANLGEQFGTQGPPHREQRLNTDSCEGVELQKDSQSHSDSIKPNFEPMSARIAGALACSALKKHYRQTLSSETNHSSKVKCVFVVLNGSEVLIRERMSRREHFMPQGLLRSQFEALELPLGEEEGGNPVIMVDDISKPVAEIVEYIIAKLQQILSQM